MAHFLEKRTAAFWIATAFGLLCFISAVDIWTGPEISLSVFYLIPIVLVTWFVGSMAGFVSCVVGAIAWFAADTLGGQLYSHPAIRYWNAFVRFGFFLAVTWLLPAMKGLEREQGLARLDYLTGAANRRFLFEALEQELNRARRYLHPFTVVYLDLDGFKSVNDRLGHTVGDAVLCTVVAQAKKYLRATDTIARLGGDEFMLLLPETDQAASQAFIPRILNALSEEMQRNNWPVTFSIGVLTCRCSSLTADELVQRADQLMYSVKVNGKNAVVYAEDASEASV